MRLSIEICTEPDQSTTDKGGLLEALAKEFLKSQGLSSIVNVRLTGMEVDLLATDNSSGEKILVECKAYRSNIAADVITKLLGNVDIRDAQAGWLITTYDFGKDAKGLVEEWGNRTVEKRRRLKFFPPESFIGRLVSAGLISEPSSLVASAGESAANAQLYLMVTPKGRYWAYPLHDPHSGLSSAINAYDAKSLNRVTDEKELAYLKTLDSSLAEYDWPSPSSNVDVDQQLPLKDELEHIVTIPVAEHWTDYRPSRPIDFVGRETIQREVFAFLERVRDGQTAIRTIALKAPSGWGKSSAVVKIADKARDRRHRAKFFVHPIDSRSARTSRFPELGVVSAMKAAISAGFVRSDKAPQFGTGANLLETADAAGIIEQLRSENKVIVIFFDQFEEILYREALSPAFDQFGVLISAIESSLPNIVVGFSWKTDGSIVTDHPAYYLWHQLADRRFETDIPPFTESEVNSAIRRFSEELGEPVSNQLARLLRDHCQGYPWLLKKLCVHIYEQVRAGVDQSDLLNRGLSIEDLFKRDLETLNGQENACIVYIAQNSPAEFYKVSEKFPETIITSLLNRRLIVRSGTRLSLYWDIFRDYVLTQKIPFIPLTYIPQANLSAYRAALDLILDAEEVSYARIGNALSLSPGATDNLVRDLVNVGHVEADRKQGTVRRLYADRKEAVKIAHDFWSTHEAFRLISIDFAGQAFSFEVFYSRFKTAVRRTDFSDKTLSIYANRILQWLQSVGLVERFQNNAFRIAESRVPNADFMTVDPRRRHAGSFLAPSSPEVTLFAFRAFPKQAVALEAANEQFGRNAVQSLIALGLLERAQGGFRRADLEINEEEALKAAARRQATIQLAKHFLDGNEDLSGSDLGDLIARFLDADWKDASKSRYGNAIARWARWAFGMQQKRRPRN
ncbi:restriction endonuclease [Croceibacterium aestuarii]|uniref:restriction endonuclease n=1 Tax=Croceibacterium aestuarii TaxID=3064139 RepID=UPI00272EA62E|nr:restriction endonuclease [Croceibacterium sp. D39]